MIYVQTLVGQQLLKHKLASYTRTGAALPHFLFVGKKNSGRKTFAAALAADLQRSTVLVNGCDMFGVCDLSGLFTNLSPNDVIIFDNLDRLVGNWSFPREMDLTLETALTSFQLNILVGRGPGARSHALHIPRFTCIGVCQDHQRISVELLRHFSVEIFADYSEDEHDAIQEQKEIAAFNQQELTVSDAKSSALTAKLTGHRKIVVGPEKRLPMKTPEDSLGELDQMIGLTSVKTEVRSLANVMRVRKLRQIHELPNNNMSLHLVFSGSPGTGKTTVARHVAEIYRGLGVLEKGQLIETDRSGLVGQYVGQTTAKTLDVASSALGGVLFVDEAYSLSRPESDRDYGQEAIETLLKFMEDNRSKLVVIVAGYTQKMQTFINSNEGLQSRFATWIEFPDYSGCELLRIFDSMCTANMFVYTEAFGKALNSYLSVRSADPRFGNGRGVRNLFESVQRSQANRIAGLSKVTVAQLRTLESDDLKDVFARSNKLRASSSLD